MTGLARGQSRSLAAGLAHGQSRGLADGLTGNEGQSMMTGLARGQSRSIASGLGRGESRGLADGLRGNQGKSLSDGLGRGNSKGLVDGTIIEDGEDEDEDGITKGTVLARIRRGARRASVAIGESAAVKKIKKTEAYDFIMKDLLELESSEKFHSDGSKIKRTLSDRGGKRRTGGKPLLEREPPEPPEVPPGEESSPEAHFGFILSLVLWLTSPAQDVSQARENVSPWPAKANRAEPGDEQLDKPMTAVLHILEKINYGVGATSLGASETKPLIELGYQVVLCMHQHRNARTNASRAAIIRQRWYLAVIDWQAASAISSQEGGAKKLAPLLVMPNAYLPQWGGRPVRVKEPVYCGGVYARGSDTLVQMVRAGKAIIYDEAATSVFVAPPGVRVKILHHSVQNKKTNHYDDFAWGDIKPLIRNLTGGKATLPFDEPLADIHLEVGTSFGLLLEELTNMVEEVAGSSGYAKLGLARLIARTFQDEMREIVRTIALDGETGSALRDLALGGAFPKVIRAKLPDDDFDDAFQDLSEKSEGGVSVHLCVSDTRRLAPDASRETVVWLTIVDLLQYNPVNAASGGYLTPKNVPIDPRHLYVVPGELTCPLSAEEVERRLEQEELNKSRREAQELRRLQTSRLERARQASFQRTGVSGGQLARARSRSKMPLASELSRSPSALERARSARGVNPRTLFKDENSLAAHAAMMAQEQAGAPPPGPAGRMEEDDDVLDADEVAQMEAANRRLRSERISRSLNLEEGKPSPGTDRLTFGT